MNAFKPDLQLVYRRLEQLIPYPSNPRKNDGVVDRMALDQRGMVGWPAAADAASATACGAAGRDARERITQRAHEFTAACRGGRSAGQPLAWGNL